MLQWTRSQGWPILRLTAGALLLVAGVLKAVELTRPEFSASGGGVWSHGLLVTAESTLAFWLLWCRPGRRGAIACSALFGVFALAAAIKVMSGAEDCGCFGPLKVSPIGSLMIDLSFCAMIIAVLPDGACPVGARGTPRFPAFVLSALALGSVVTLISWRASQSNDAAMVNVGDLIVFNVERWMGSMCPILRFLERNDRDELATGRWCLIVTRPDCPVCRRVVPSLLRQARKDPKWRYALVELPVENFGDETSQADIRHVHLSREKRWFIRTPAQIFLENGKVVRVNASFDSEPHRRLVLR